MSSINPPKNMGNANKIFENIAVPSKLAMIKYEHIFDYYAEEPEAFIIRIDEYSESIVLSRICRIRYWGKLGKCCSWSIYSDSRQELNNVLVRKVIWNMDQDKTVLKKLVRDDREKALSTGPSLDIYNMYIPELLTLRFIKLIKDFDTKIENGIILKENPHPIWPWRDLEVLRLFDWGQIHLTWAPNKSNEIIEDCLLDFTLAIDNLLKDVHDNIYSMELLMEKR